MVFSSAVFLIGFLPITLLVYFLVPKKHIGTRNFVLLVFSLIFYGWGEPKYILVMLLSILINYLLAILIEKKDRKKLFLVIDIIFNLLTLGFFKYANLVIETASFLMNQSFDLLDVALPIGISFYTFQTMSYVIDVYRGKVKAQYNFISLSCYVTLFPQLIAGPIVRYSDVEIELKNRESSIDQISYGIKRFIQGLAKKVLIANQVAVIWDNIYSALENGFDISIGAAWLGAIAFTFQIYFDFSGYSDMAIGLGRIFGFKYLENFDYPYMSKSITEFWRRWHISLSSWFKEYVYIPLGGNKKGLLIQIFNILIVWALTGLWHGANYNFVLWGVYYGVLLILEKVFILKITEKIPDYFKGFFTMIVVIIGWVIFNITDFSMLGMYLKSMFSGNFTCEYYYYYLSSRAWVLLIAAILSAPFIKDLYQKISKKLEDTQIYKGVFDVIIFGALLLLSIAFVISGTYNPFLYFRF